MMIAIAGPNLPLDLLVATDRFAGPVAFDPDRETPRASQWIESKFGAWAHPMFETWAEGGYDHLQHVLFSRADDTSQRCYYYVCELQYRGILKGPEPLILDIAKIPRALSVERTVAKLRELGEQLDVEDAALETAIVQNNLRRRAMHQPAAAPACLLAGTPPPDGRLHDIIANCGFTAVGKSLPDDWMDLGDVVEERSGDPYAMVGMLLHSMSSGARAFADPADRLRNAASASGAAAIILWRTEEDEAQSWHLPDERLAIEALGIPGLVLTRRDWLGNDGVDQEIRAFLNGVSA